MVGAEGAAVDHVEDTTGGTDDDVDALLELGHVLTDVGTTDAGVALDVHVIAEGDDDLLDLLSELTGGGEDERLGAFDGHVELITEGVQRQKTTMSTTTLTCCRMEMEKVAVLPVPDWACAITSWPFTTGTMARC